MTLTQPTLFPAAFASGAGTYFGGKNTIPTTSAQPLASLADGFPSTTMLPITSGGVPPSGADFNGILNWITLHCQWLNSGGWYNFSASQATAIGGYQPGMVINLNGGGTTVTPTSTTTTDPNSSMTNWTGGSALDGFMPAGVGAVQASVQAKLRQTVSVIDFGAVAGTGLSNAIRTANTTAINNAISQLRGIANLDFSNGPFEVNGTIILGTVSSQLQTRTGLFGKGDEASSIIGYGISGPIVDGTGAPKYSMVGITINAATACESGLLLARNTASQECDNWAMENVTIKGLYTKAPLINICAEIFRATDCRFSNGYPNAYSFMTSPDNTVIGATTTMGPILASTNTDIKFTNCKFFGEYQLGGYGHFGAYFESAFEGAFVNCFFSSQPATISGQNTNLIYIKGRSGTWAGKVVFSACHFEVIPTAPGAGSVFTFCTGTSNFFGTVSGTTLTLNSNAMGTLNSPGGALSGVSLTTQGCTISALTGGSWGQIGSTYSLSSAPGNVTNQPLSINSTFTQFAGLDLLNCNILQNAVDTTFVYDYITNAMLYRSSMRGCNNDNALTLTLPRMTLCEMDCLLWPVNLGGNVISSTVIGGSISWVATFYSQNSVIIDGTNQITNYGVTPGVFGTVSSNYNGQNSSRLALNPLYYPPITTIRGELLTLDMAHGYMPVIGASAYGDVLCHFNGLDYKPVGAYYGTPATSSASGIAGQVVYDTNYIYICTNSGTNYTALSGVTGSITAGSRTLTVNNASGFTGAPIGGIGCFITVAGLSGPQQITWITGTTITLAAPALATVTNGAVTWATPAWKRSAIATW